MQPPPGGYGPPPGGGYGGPPGPPPGGGYGGPPGPPGGGYGGPPGPPGGGYGGPPNPYGPPGGMGGPPGGMGGGSVPGLTPEAAGVLQERSFVTVLLLAMVTCGIYGIIVSYQRREELRIATGDESIKPGMDLLLTFLLCGIWGLYADYRDAQKIASVFKVAGVQREDKSTMILVMKFVFSLISAYWLQEEFNALARLAKGEYRG